MDKKRSIKAFLTLMIAVAAVFAATQVVAQTDCEPPTSCTSGDWTVTLVKVSPQPNDPGQYAWTYQVTNSDGDTKGLNHVNFSIPVCCPDEIQLQKGSGATLHIYSPGAGDDTTTFGKWLLQIYVAKFTLNDPQDGTWTFVSNTEHKTKISVGLKVGNDFFSCEIAGPGCSGYALPVVQKESYVTTADSKNFKILEEPYGQCITNVFELDDQGNVIRELAKSEVGDVLKAEYQEGEYDDLVFLGVPGQACARAMGKSDGPHTWYFISGRWVWR